MFGGSAYKIATRQVSIVGEPPTPEPPAPPVYLHGYTTISRSNLFTLPANCEENDIVVYWGAGGANTTWPGGGWTSIFSRSWNGVQPSARLMCRRLTSGFSTTYNLGSSFSNYSSIIAVFRGVTTDTLPPRDGTANAITSFSLDPSAYTTTIGVGTAIVVVTSQMGTLSKSTVVAPSGYTLVAAEEGSGNNNETETVAMAYKILTSSGTEDPGPFSGMGNASRIFTLTTSLKRQ